MPNDRDGFGEIRDEGVRAARERKFGPDACCARCGITDLDKLVHFNRTVLDDHHIFGANHAPEVTEMLCRNCHAEATEEMRKGGAVLREQSTVLDTVAAVMHNQGVTLEAWSKMSKEWASHVKAFRHVLDAKFPKWRRYQPKPPRHVGRKRA